MQVQRGAGAKERQVLTWMIVDDEVLDAIQVHWHPQRFGSRYANLVAGWCIDHFRKYGSAPRKAIRTYYTDWIDQQQPDDKTVRVIENLLASLSDEYTREEEFSAAHAIDRATEFFNQIALQRLTESLEEGSPQGIPKMLELVTQFEPIALQAGLDVDPLDAETHRRTLQRSEELLIDLPGDLGKFFGSSLRRDAFVALMAAEKRGKSFWLLDLAYRAVSQRRRVLYFEAGDMSEHQVLERIRERIVRRPLKARTIQYPKAITENEGVVTVTHEERKFRGELTMDELQKEVTRFRRGRLRSDANFWRMSFHPSGTLTIGMILQETRRWMRRGWVPDVIVIDYADILATDQRTQEFRHATNEVWKGLRRISQEFHCLVLTATQADAKAYTKNLLDLSNFSEDKRKYAHVTGVVGLNSNDDDRRQGITRLNWLVRRDAAFDSRRACKVAGCLDIANPAILSVL